MKSYKGQGKDYLLQLKCLKRLCIRFYGIGFLFCSARIRSILLETMHDFIDTICEGLKNE